MVLLALAWAASLVLHEGYAHAERSTVTGSHAVEFRIVNRTTADGLASDDVLSVHARGKQVLAATAKGLSVSVDGGVTFVTKAETDGLGCTSVRAVTSASGIVYAATASGVFISRDGARTFQPHASPKGIVLRLFADDQLLLVATSRGLALERVGGNDPKVVSESQGLGSSMVYGACASGGRLFAATDSGLAISPDGGESFVNRTEASGLPSSHVRSVCADGQRVFVATRGGMAASRDGGVTFSACTALDGLGNDVAAAGQAVCIATSSGLGVSIDGGVTFTNLTTAHGLGDNDVRSVHIQGGRALVATRGGLSVVDLPSAISQDCARAVREARAAHALARQIGRSDLPRVAELYSVSGETVIQHCEASVEETELGIEALVAAGDAWCAHGDAPGALARYGTALEHFKKIESALEQQGDLSAERLARVRRKIREVSIRRDHAHATRCKQSGD